MVSVCWSVTLHFLLIVSVPRALRITVYTCAYVPHFHGGIVQFKT